MSSLARNVHFVAEDGSHQAAIVSATHADGTLGLTIFPGLGVRTESRVPRDDGQLVETRGADGKATGKQLVHGARTWHLPERVEEPAAPKAEPAAAKAAK
jgi:hypothetical protein